MISCNTCPYINNMDTDNVLNEYCDKIDCKVYICGPCEEVDDIPRRKPKTQYKHRTRNKHERYLLGKNKLERIADISVGWPPAASRRDKNREHTEDPNETMYIRRYYRANHAPGYSGHLKKLSSKIVRRHKMELPKCGCGYRKIFDYWWELY